MKTFYSLLLGFSIAGITVAAMGLAMSLYAWQEKGMVEWGIILILLGTTSKVLVEKL